MSFAEWKKKTKLMRVAIACRGFDNYHDDINRACQAA